MTANLTAKDRNFTEIEKVLEDILNVHESSVILVRNKGCQLIFANSAAKNQIENRYMTKGNCKDTYAAIFPKLCDFCNKHSQPAIDIEDTDGQAFSLTGKRVNWLDGVPATLFVLNDVEEERKSTKKLFSLVYMDYLTQIPNRRKLKEDFKPLEEDILSGIKEGVVAIFDLDHFKNVNDTYGHNTGDMMLQRLTQHLQGDPAFEGHLYRLGGDEFAFLYAEKRGTHLNLRKYYKNLLEGAIKSYTLPNIHVSCQISMGIAFFPEHGNDLYTLLRKADIALYEAKNAGRNRLVLFENKFDIVQEFKDVYISIQPILDASGNTFGYELTEEIIDKDNEKETVSLTDFNRTLDIMELDKIYNQQLYFVNYAAIMVTTAEKNLLNSNFVIQVENTDTIRGEDLKNYKKLKNMGFSIAINCKDINRLRAELVEIAEYIKIEPNKNIVGAIKNLGALIRSLDKNITLAAVNINDEAQLQLAQKAGCTLYQGHYFKQAKKVTEKIKSVEPLQSNYYKLLMLTCTDADVDFKEISEVVSSDPALSYKLLKMLNTVEFRTKNKISSVSMALPYIGEQRLKQWISLMSLRGIAPDKPLELIRQSLIRAKFSELIAPKLKEPHDNARVFMMGMLSLLHIALDKTQESLLDEMSIAEDIRDSLLGDLGKYSALAAFYKNYEHCDWEEVSKFAKNNEISGTLINDLYIAATKWYNELNTLVGEI